MCIQNAWVHLEYLFDFDSTIVTPKETSVEYIDQEKNLSFNLNP